MVPRRQALLFAGAVALLWALFVVQAWNTPVLLDDWYQLTWHRNHPFGLSSLWEYFHFNYFHFNPRIGDLLLLIVNGPRLLHLALTPVVELGLLWVAFAVGFGRWPRPSLADLRTLLLIQVLIWIVIPIPGIIYFYRPFATNYLWGFATTLGLFVPFRLALARTSPAPARWWAVPCMFALGWLSGMSNEHTGPTQMVALLVLVGALWKAGKLRAWMVAGLTGLYIGYPMLFFAPGQAQRYAGMATRNSPITLLKERGLGGCLDIVLDFLGEAQHGLFLVLLIVVVYLRARQRRGEPVPRPARRELVAIVALVLAAGAIVVTQFASPTVGERLYFAPAVLLVLAAAVVVEPMLAERRVRWVIVPLLVAIFGYHAYRFVGVYWFVKRDNDARIALLRAAKPDTIAEVPPYKAWRRTRWHWGDDFQYASLREYVANEVFDLKNIAYQTKVLRWSEPAPPDHYVATRVYDPPLAPEVAATLVPVRYIPTFWEWSLVQLRRMLVLRGLGEHDGHRLVRYTVDSEGLGFADPKHRPIHVLDWTPSKLTFVDGRLYDDDHGRSFIRIWQDSVPPRLTEAYVVGCNKTVRVVPWPDLTGRLGPLIPIQPDCRGSYAVVLCEPDACWLSGRKFWP